MFQGLAAVVQGGMATARSKILMALAATHLTVAPAFAQLAGPTLMNPSPAAPVKKPTIAEKAKACPEYGAGYVRLDSGTCVKIGGYLRIEGSSSR
jgi:hypothetical protein